MKKIVSLPLFYFCFGLVSFSANLAHPITPSFFEMLRYPNYMFGLAFSLMAVGSFVLSPMWSKLADKHGYLKVMALGIGLYGVGQIWFGLSRTILSTAFARLFSGAFTAAMNVGGMLYLSNSFDETKKGERITLGMAIQIASGSLGFFLGGYLGNINIMLPFYVQPTLCLLDAAIIYFVLQETNQSSQKQALKLSEINPFKAFVDVAKIMTPALAVFYIMSALTVFSFTSFDTSFNYYIRNVHKLSPIYNGLIKGSVGVIGLIINLSLNKYIVSKFNNRLTLGIYYFLSLLVIAVLMLNANIQILIISALLYYTLDTMAKPVQQILGTSSSTVYGAYNSMTAVGMVSGSLSAGYLYTINPMLPFYSSFVVMLISLVLSIYNKKQYANGY